MKIKTFTPKPKKKETFSISENRSSYKYIQSIKQYRDNHALCERCYARGKQTISEQVHHIIQVADGGQTTGDNLLALCRACHKVIAYEDISLQRTYKTF